MWNRILAHLPQEAGWQRKAALVLVGLLVALTLAVIVTGGFLALLVFSPKAYGFQEDMGLFAGLLLAPAMLLFVTVLSAFAFGKRVRSVGTPGGSMPNRSDHGRLAENVTLGFMVSAPVALVLWGDLVDFTFATVIVTGGIYFVRQRRQISAGWPPVGLAVAFSLCYLADKVGGYPHHPNSYAIEIDALSLVVLAGIITYCTSIMVWRGQWKAPLAAILVLFLPIIELPAELLRQAVGRSLIADSDGRYFTKIRPDVIYYLDVRRRPTRPGVTFLHRTSQGFEESGWGPAYIGSSGGSFDSQMLRVTPVAFHLREFIWGEER